MMKKILLFLIMLSFLPGAVFGEAPAPDPAETLLRFRLYRNDFMEPQNYELFLLGDAYYLYINDDLPLRVDHELADELVRMINQYDIRSWDGFDESDPEVDDGEFFVFSAALSDGTSIHARGQNAFPSAYDPAASEMERRILWADGETIEEDISGTYVYEGEGSGGGLTITLGQDGSYIINGGASGAASGKGAWTREGGTVILSDENGSVSRFAAGNSVLIFIERISDNFPDHPLPDGGIFSRK